MKSSAVFYSSFLSLIVLTEEVLSFKCSKQILGRTFFLNCPEVGDSLDKIYCCGTKKFRYCCTSEEFVEATDCIGLIIGILLAEVIILAAAVVVSCFYCRCCLWAKYRKQMERIEEMHALGVISAPTATYLISGTTEIIDSYQPQRYSPQQPPQQYGSVRSEESTPSDPPPPYKSTDQLAIYPKIC